MIASGRFISLEGPEGSGKTTQCARLSTRLRATGLEVVQLREPGGTPLGEAIRSLLQHDAAGESMAPAAETLLFLASRAHLVRQVIRPALERGAWVVCDRFFDSTIAYQGYGRGCDVEEVISVNEFAVGGLRPDITVLIDLDVAAGFERLARRNASVGAGHDRIEREEQSFHERVRAGYLELARRWPKRIRTIGGDRAADALEEDIWNLVRHEFSL